MSRIKGDGTFCLFFNRSAEARAAPVLFDSLCLIFPRFLYATLRLYMYRLCYSLRQKPTEPSAKLSFYEPHTLASY